MGIVSPVEGRRGSVSLNWEGDVVLAKVGGKVPRDGEPSMIFMLLVCFVGRCGTQPYLESDQRFTLIVLIWRYACRLSPYD